MPAWKKRRAAEQERVWGLRMARGVIRSHDPLEPKKKKGVPVHDPPRREGRPRVVGTVRLSRQREKSAAAGLEGRGGKGGVETGPGRNKKGFFPSAAFSKRGERRRRGGLRITSRGKRGAAGQFSKTKSRRSRKVG